MNKRWNYTHYEYSSSELDDDEICIIDEIPPQNKNFCQSVTLSETSLSNEERKRKYEQSSSEDSYDEVEHYPKEIFTIDRKRNRTNRQNSSEIVYPESSPFFSGGYYECEDCDAYFGSYDTFRTHFNESGHANAVMEKEKNMKTSEKGRCLRQNAPGNMLNQNSSRYPQVPYGVIRRLIRDESFIQLEVETNLYACPGLEHVIEIRGLRNTFYFCEFCNVCCGIKDIIFHLGGSKHQLFCLKALWPEEYKKMGYMPKCQRRSMLQRLLRWIQDREGIGKIVVEKDYLDDRRTISNANFRDLDTPGTSSDYPSGLQYDEESVESLPIISNSEETNYFCPRCECHMFDTKLWESHFRRNPYLKRTKSCMDRSRVKVVIPKPKSEAFLTDRLGIIDEPIVGLGFIREFQHFEDKKETYHCMLCGDCISFLDITSHLISLSHRRRYLEHIDHYSVDEVRILNRRENKSYFIVEEICRNVQREMGSGFPEVYVIKNSL